jgi:hypothetical protein
MSLRKLQNLNNSVAIKFAEPLFSLLLIPAVLNLPSINTCRPVAKCVFERVSGFDITTLQLRL